MTLLAGCGPATPEHASTTASAQSPDFPDFSGFTAVDEKSYYLSRPRFGGILFATPDGQLCDTNAMNSLNDPSVTVFTCLGVRPDKGPGEWHIRVKTNEAAAIEPGSTDRVETNSFKPLPPMHTIAYDGIFCGVDDKGTTACRLGEHGFVLTPTDTKLF